MTSTRFHRQARAELIDAAGYYEKQTQGLGVRFLEVVDLTIVQIEKNPTLFRLVAGEIRKCRVPRFPYGLLFRLRSGQIEILAVMHLHREPGYWNSRR